MSPRSAVAALVLGLAVGALAATAPAARADEEPGGHSDPLAGPATSGQPASGSSTGIGAVGGGPLGTRDTLAQQLAEESGVLERTRETVASKLLELDHQRARRLAAAYRILRADPAVAADPIATARRRAAARWLVARDLGERRLLADEGGQLAVAATRTTSDTARVATVELPPPLAWPAHGDIARHFGTLVHERSKATLARRGLDLDVDFHARVTAMADGTVRYAGPIRGLDSGILVDHGTYWTLLGKLDELAVPVGAHVVRGDRLGRAARSRVYVEVRVKIGPGGMPVDPGPLLTTDSR